MKLMMKRLNSLIWLIFLILPTLLFSQDYTLGRAISYRNLSVWPVYLSVEYDLSMLITLDAGISGGTVRVEEMGGDEAYDEIQVNQILSPAEEPESEVRQQSDQTVQNPLEEPVIAEVRQVQNRTAAAQVNTLQVINESDKYLFIAAGEIIKGGKQNRVVSRDVIIPPGEASGALDVFCVEQGRWTAYEDSGNSFASAKELVAQNSLKRTILAEADQSAVWEKVSELNAAQEVSTETGNYLAGIEEGIDDEAAAEYVLSLLPQLTILRPAGIVAAVNGTVQGADVYFDPRLFAAHAEKILRSYAYDALILADDTAAEYSAAEVFLSSVFAAAGDVAAETGHYRYLTLSGKDLRAGHLQYKDNSGTTDVHIAAVRIETENDQE